jgi:hypothetical protein
MPDLVVKTVSKLCAVCGGFKGFYGRLNLVHAGPVENTPFYTSFVRVVVPIVFSGFLSEGCQVMPGFHKPYYNNYLFNSFNGSRRIIV